METDHPATTSRVIDAEENINRDRSASHGSPINNISRASSTLLNGQFSTPKQMGQHLDTKKRLREFLLKKIKMKPKLFKCDVCNKEFSSASGILSHQRTHHYLQDRKMLRCNICDKLFSNPRGLLLHYRLHTGYKPYKCEICLKSFTTSSHFSYHQKTHMVNV